MSTHDIDPEEARRLVKQTTLDMKREAYHAKHLDDARVWFKGWTVSEPMEDWEAIYTPWGSYTIKELTE